MSNVYLGDTYGVSETTIRRWKQRMNEEARSMAVEGLSIINGSSLGAERALMALRGFNSNIPEPLEHFGSAMVSGDVHIPLTNQNMVKSMFSKAKENDLSTLILAGDTFNADSLSRFDLKQKDHTLKQELDIGREFVGACLDEFERVILFKGNHEDRFIRALGYKLDFAQTMELILGEVYDDSKLVISNLDHMKVFGPQGKEYYVCHPKAYSRQPLATGRALASKWNCNIICAHAHHHAIGTDISGRYVIAELGGLFDPDKAAYLKEATTFPKQSSGLVWINNEDRLASWSPLWEQIS